LKCRNLKNSIGILTMVGERKEMILKKRKKVVINMDKEWDVNNNEFSFLN